MHAHPNVCLSTKVAKICPYALPKELLCQGWLERSGCVKGCMAGILHRSDHSHHRITWLAENQPYCWWSMWDVLHCLSYATAGCLTQVLSCPDLRCHARAGAGAEAEAPVGLQQRDAGAAPGVRVRVRCDPEHAAGAAGKGRADGGRQVHAARAHRRLRPRPLGFRRCRHEGALENSLARLFLAQFLLLSLQEPHLVSKWNPVPCLSGVHLPRVGFLAHILGCYLLLSILEAPLII